MSDFRLPEIAPFLEKDARSLRRWCEQGIVPGAYRSAGGHWRITGETVQAIVATIQRQVPKSCRRRKETAYPPEHLNSSGSSWGLQGITPRQAWRVLEERLGANSAALKGDKVRGWLPMELWGKPTPLDPFSDFEWGNLDNPTERRLALVKAARAVVEEIQRHREGEEYLRDCFMRHMDNRHPDSSWDRTAMYEELGAGGRKVRTVWTKNRAGTYDVSEKKIYTPRFTVILLSKKLGISRSTFYRWFPKWKKLLRAVWGEIKDEEDGRTNEIP